MLVITNWSRNGEPVANGTEPIVLEKSALRVNQKGTVYVYITVPVMVTDESGKGLVRTTASGSLILRAAPVLD